MFLSSLEIDVSNYRGRTWIANPYRIHQRLLMAYPDALAEAQAGRLLFRVEDTRRPPRILVQAPLEADWPQGFADHPVLLQVQQKQIEPSLSEGRRLKFLLRANPVRRSNDTRARLGLLREQDQRKWLMRKAETAGFRPLAFDVLSRGLLKSRGNPAKGRSVQTHLCVDFEGLLQIIDPQAFAEVWRNGIGPAKAFGFGLLSLAPAGAGR